MRKNLKYVTIAKSAKVSHKSYIMPRIIAHSITIFMDLCLKRLIMDRKRKRIFLGERFIFWKLKKLR